MRQRTKFALALALVYLPTLGAITLVTAVLWAHPDAQQRAAVAAIARQHTTLVIVLPLALLAIQGVLLHSFFRQYLVSPLEVAERIKIILNANPSHRIAPTGGPELRALEEVINDLAARHEALQRDVDLRIAEARARLEVEKSLLAAVISALAQGVVVCNAEGRILLYNERATELVTRGEGKASAQDAGRLVGLGRSVFGIFDRGLVAHALATLRAHLEKGEARPVATFVGAVGPRLVRAQMAPVIGTASAPPVDGFVLVLDDVTAAVEAVTRQEASRRSLLEGSRRAAANIRAAVETVLAYPDIEARTQLRFMEVIREEVAGLGTAIDRASREHAAAGAEWLLDEMLAADLVAAAARRIEDELGLRVAVEVAEPSPWLKVDGHALVRAVTAIARRLRDEFGVGELRLACAAAGHLAQLDVTWTGAVVPGDTLTRWENAPLESGGASPTLKHVLDRHDGEVLHVVDEAAGGGLLRFLLPLHEPPRAPSRARTGRPARPEYHDFDLFQRAGPAVAELERRELRQLVYTAFDTETTGLDPSEGDEILAIGAVRIVNGRLLRGEVFEQLVDPRRPVSAETVAVTGLDPAALSGQPSIAEVLPRFHAFCEDTVLVAHNAAFDLRFLQLKEEATGVRFGQPVLDTLLLAAAIQPHLDPLGLEALAERLGVDTIGRHTALGDAIMTGEIFLKMLPLLAERGIVTLGDARAASRRTRQARMRY